MEGKLLNNHIEFKFIRNAYPLHEKLFCYFQSPNVSLWQPEIGDWIGLFKVGWSTLNEHRVRKMIQNECLESRRNVNVDYVHVVFEQHDLPKDVDGLYQFVYVTKNDVVRGISGTFKFDRVVVPQVELRRMVDVMGKQQQQQQQQECEIQLPKTESVMGKIESDLMKECQRLNLNWGKITDDAVSGKLIQKYLNNMKSIQKDDEITRKVEELFVENGKLCMSLKTRIQEVCELKKECEEVKNINGDLLGKLTIAERKVEQLEREREQNIRKISELTMKETQRGYEQIQGKQQGCGGYEQIQGKQHGCGGYEQIQGKQHGLHQLEETAKWLLQEDCERIQPELKRATSLYGELETTIEGRIKLGQQTVEEPIQQQQRRGHLIEKILREVDGTPNQIRLLKRVIEDLKTDNELLRERVRQVETTTELTGRQQQQQDIQVPAKKSIIKEVTVCPRINLVPMELVGLHGESHSLPIVGESSFPSISVSTLEVPTTKTTSVTITGKINGVEQPKQQWQQWKQQQQQQQQPRQWQQEQEQQQQQPQQQLRGQVGEYLCKLDEQIRTKIEERLRNKLQEQLQGRLTEQQQQQQTRPMYKVDDLIRQKMEHHQQKQQQQQQQWSLESLEEVLPTQKWRVQQQQQLEEQQIRKELSTQSLQQVLSTMCPVCGIAMPNELNVCDFEIHVNSHFTD